VRLTVDPLGVQEGAFVVIESGAYLFYGLVTDMQLAAADPRFAAEQTEKRLSPVLARPCMRRRSSRILRSSPP